MSKPRIFRRIVIVLVISSMFGFALRSSLTAAAADKTEKGERRQAEQVVSEIQTVGNQLREVFSSPDILLSPEKIKEIAPKAAPLMKKLVGLFEELSGIDERSKPKLIEAQRQLLAMLAGMNDEEAAATLAKRAEEKDGARWKATVLLVRWWQSNKDPAEQSKVLDELEKVAKSNSKDESLAVAIGMFFEQGAANDEMRDRVEKIFLTELKSAAALEIANGIQAASKLRALNGKPLTLEGTTVDGSNFSTADWKGKVILVDFWATWCPPCREELPRVKKAYADFHKEGLEVLGVSSDRKTSDLKQFMTENPDMPWPQLFDPASGAKQKWHPLAESYGITGIPTMFLIDKKGVVRTVTARENFEELIPKMLKEEAQ